MVTKDLILDGMVIGRGAYRNFSGAMKFGRAGKRTFTILLNEETAIKIEQLGWHIRWRDPRDDQEGRQGLMDVEARFDNYPPDITLTIDGSVNPLNEDTVSLLDNIDFDDSKTHIVLHPSNWTLNGQSGTKAYLRELNVTQKEYLADRISL